MTEHDDLRDWDAAYLLGSLSMDDRRRYERHLADCEACSASVAELAGLPGLLARVPVAEAVLEGEPNDAPNLLPRLTAHVACRRRRTRRWVVAVSVGAVAAILAVGIAVAPGLVDSLTTPPTVAMQLQPVGSSPLEASIRLIDEQWGTRIEMECQYERDAAYSAPAEYSMYVTDAAGDEARVATWSAAPGQTATPSASTSLTLSQIRTIEVRSVSGTVLLRGSR